MTIETPRKPRPKYANKYPWKAVCLRCYTCQLTVGSKRHCEIAATSHGKLYGHDVTILRNGHERSRV